MSKFNDDDFIQERLHKGKEALENFAEVMRKDDPASPLLARVTEYLQGSQCKAIECSQEERLRKGEEVLKNSEELLRSLREQEQARRDEWEKARQAHDADPFAKKLTQASMAILDRVIERNQPAKAQAARQKLNAKSRNIGENLRERLEESGLSIYRLSKLTGFDKKLISGHLKGEGCSLPTCKIYADVFTAALGRKISTDLET